MATDDNRGLPFEKRPVGSITYAALRQLNLKLSCRDCGYVRIFNCAALRQVFESRGWDDRSSAVSRRFWCSRCRMLTGRKIKNMAIAFVNEDETGDPPPLPDERSWKHFVRRFRS